MTLRLAAGGFCLMIELFSYLPAFAAGPFQFSVTGGMLHSGQQFADVSPQLQASSPILSIVPHLELQRPPLPIALVMALGDGDPRYGETYLLPSLFGYAVYRRETKFTIVIRMELDGGKLDPRRAFYTWNFALAEALFEELLAQSGQPWQSLTARLESVKSHSPGKVDLARSQLVLHAAQIFAAALNEPLTNSPVAEEAHAWLAKEIPASTHLLPRLQAATVNDFAYAEALFESLQETLNSLFARPTYADLLMDFDTQLYLVLTERFGLKRSPTFLHHRVHPGCLALLSKLDAEARPKVP